MAIVGADLSRKGRSKPAATQVLVSICSSKRPEKPRIPSLTSWEVTLSSARIWGVAGAFTLSGKTRVISLQGRDRRELGPGSGPNHRPGKRRGGRRERRPPRLYLSSLRQVPSVWPAVNHETEATRTPSRQERCRYRRRRCSCDSYTPLLGHPRRCEPTRAGLHPRPRRWC